MRMPQLSSGFGVVLIGVGLFTAFLLGDFIPGMVLAGFIMAFTGMVALNRGDPSTPDKDAG